MKNETLNFINKEYINSLLVEAKNTTEEEITQILNKAEKMEKLNHLDIAKLFNISNNEQLNRMYQIAFKIKKEIYGNRIVLFAPLYVSDYCVNNCTYCGYKHCNKFKRRKLTMQELSEEVKILEAMGHKRLALEAGEDPINCDINYILSCIDTIYKTYKENGKIRRINVNIAATSVENYKKLKYKGIGTYILFQETYDRDVYLKCHPNCLKSNYEYHLNSFDRAMEAGIEDVGAGVLFGLSDPRFEVLALMIHNEHLEEKFKVGFHTISVPRLRPALGVNLETMPHLLDDETFKKIVTIIRLAVPYTGMILSTRESKEMRSFLLKCGISQVSAGSCTGVGGYMEHIKGSNISQFELQDQRSPREVIDNLISDGYIPSYCTACYRTGRTGETFMKFAKSCEINNMCNANALTTLLEYGFDYGDKDMLKKITTFVNKEKNKITNKKIKNFVDSAYEKIKDGKRDLYL